MTDARALGEELIARFRRRDATVAVMGLGYVGLPIALLCVERGFRVIGYDTDAKKMERLARGAGAMNHIDPERVSGALSSRRFVPTSDASYLADADAYLITVPTPVNRRREPDLSEVASAAGAIARVLRPGRLVVLESTSYPGTTDGLVRATLEETGLVSGRDVFLAFSPEREDPGNRRFSTSNIPKIVAGVDPLSSDVACAFYAEVVERVVRVSSARVAEAAKLSENVFRGVNIALANELKIIFDKMGIDVWEVLDAAATKPFGFSRFDPGPGWGGHCVPVDPFYLAWKARQVGAPTRFIELAGEINVAMPGFVLDKLENALDERGTTLRDKDILVLGVAYKKDVDDTRETPAFELMRRLIERGAKVAYHDPLVPRIEPQRSFPELPELSSEPLDRERIARADAVVVVTNHSVVDYDLVLAHARLVIDTRGVYRRSAPNLVRA